jgi:hypothetical protein
MITASIRKARRFSALIATTAALSLGLAATPAFAVGVTAVGGPTQIELPNTGSVWLYIGSTRYIGQTTAPPPANCGGRTIPGVSVDTLRGWLAVSQAALLSGKNLTIYYDSCDFGQGPVHYIMDLALVK